MVNEENKVNEINRCFIIVDDDCFNIQRKYRGC